MQTLHKRLVLFVAILFVVFPVKAPAVAAVQSATASSGESQALDSFSVDGLVDRQLTMVDTTEVEQFLDDLQTPPESPLSDLSVRTILDYMTGKQPFPGASTLFQWVARMLYSELYQQLSLLGKLITLAVLAALLRNIQAAFENDTVGRVAYAVVYLTLAAIAISSFQQALGIARGIVAQLVEFMVALLPLITTLLAGVGALISAGIFQPLILITVNIVSLVAANVVMPLLFLAAVIHIVDRFSDGIHVSRLADLLQQVGMTVMGLAMCLLLGIVSAQGAAGAVADGVAVRSAKFASKAFVPILGSMFSDSMELVAGSSLILKNAATIYGLVGVFVISIYPATKLLALVLVYRLGAALIQPIDDGPTVGLLTAMAGSLTLLTVCAGAVMIMFFIVLSIVAGLGNAAVMLR